MEICALLYWHVRLEWDGVMSTFSGDRKYKIPVLDPFDVTEVKIINDGARPTGISITLRNAKVYGLKDAVLKKAMWVCVAAHQVRLPHTSTSS